MHQLIDKKHKIIIYFTFLLILSTTSTRFEKKSTSYFSKNNKINVKGLSIIHNQKILNELNNLAHHNIFFLGKEEIDRIILYLIFLLILSTTSNKIIDNEKKNFIKINNIKVTGLSSVNNSKILNKLDNFYYKNIFIISKKEITKIFLEYNIIEEYKIKKIYPSKLNIDIKPTKFIAKIPGNKQLLVGSNGKLIKTKILNEKLPYIFGEFNSKEFLNFKKNIEQSKFTFIKFKTLYFFRSNRWDILTHEDVLIKLPRDDISASLNIAYEIISNNDFKDKNSIDLRIKNQLIIK
jgi:cell division protein FtsQ